MFNSSVVFSVSSIDFLMIPFVLKSVMIPAPATAKDPIQSGGKNIPPTEKPKPRVE